MLPMNVKSSEEKLVNSLKICEEHLVIYKSINVNNSVILNANCVVCIP